MNPNPTTSEENFRMYHQLQYDRIDRLESKRETFSNLIITISIAVFTFAYSKESGLEKQGDYALPILIILVNVVAIIFAAQSRYFIKMHQRRAEIAREMFAPALNLINDQVDKKDGNKDYFNRNRLYILLHILFIIAAIVYVITSNHCVMS